MKDLISGKKIETICSITVINPNSGEIFKDQDISVKDDKISKISPSKPISTNNVLDGRNLYAIPGLIDTHVHALNFLYDKIPGIFDLKWVFRQQVKNLQAYIRSGVTTIRDMTSALKLIKKYSIKAAQFKIEAPRIIFAGPMFTVKNGYPYFIEKVPFFVNWIAGKIRIDLKLKNGEIYARSLVNKVARSGARCIKVGYQSVKYDDNNTEIPIIPLYLLKVIVEQAHSLKLPVAVHCCYHKDLQKLLEATDITFDSLEHLTIDEPLSNEEITKFASRKIPISTTLMTYGIKDHVDKLQSLIEQESHRFEKKPLNFLKFACKGLKANEQVSHYIGIKCIETGSKYMRENLKNLKQAGVKIAYASDSAGAITPAGCPHWELLDMVRAGMTPLEALRAATSVAAEIIEMPNLGKLEEGCIADIVLLRRNPLENIDAVKDVVAVIREGRLMFNVKGL